MLPLDGVVQGAGDQPSVKPCDTDRELRSFGGNSFDLSFFFFTFFSGFIIVADVVVVLDVVVDAVVLQA